MTDICPVVLILLLSTFTFSFAGFGFSMLAVPLLTLIYPTGEAVAFQFVYAVFLVLYQAVRFRGEIAWRFFGALALGATVCMPLGAYALQTLPDNLLKRCLAIVLLTAIAANRSSWGHKITTLFKSSLAWGVLWGAVSGLIQGAFTTGGPPAVIYVRYAIPDPVAGKGILGIYFSMIYLFMVPVLAYGGLFSREILLKAFWFSPAVISGTFAGALAFSKIRKKENYYLFVDFLLLITAVLLWTRA